MATKAKEKVEETVVATPAGVRPETLATELGISGKVIRAFCRQTWPRPLEEKRSSWYLTEEQAEAVRTRFAKVEDDESDDEE